MSYNTNILNCIVYSQKYLILEVLSLFYRKIGENAMIYRKKVQNMCENCYFKEICNNFNQDLNDCNHYYSLNNENIYKNIENEYKKDIKLRCDYYKEIIDELK